MYTGEHILTVTRAAAIAGVEPRSVNDAIERGVLPPALWRGEERRRRLAFEGCLALSFYYHAQNALTAELRRYVLSRYFRDLEAASAHRSEEHDHHRKVVKALKVHRDSLRLDHHFPRERFRYEAAFLVVDLYPFFEKVNAAAADLEAAEMMVTVDPGVVGGAACIRDTRIPVHDVAASVRAGIPMAEILEGYPDLSERDVRLAAIYAKAHPPRGRPRGAKDAWPDARLSHQSEVKRGGGA